MLRRELRQFVEFVVDPRAAISSSDVRSGSWTTSLRGLFVVFGFVLVNIVLFTQQALHIPITDVHPLEFFFAVYDYTLQFLVILTSIVLGYIFALILLSRSTNLLQSLRSLLYAGGGFLILHFSAEAAIPAKYWPVPNTIRFDLLRTLGAEHTRDYQFGATGAWDTRIDIFGTGAGERAVVTSDRQPDYTYDQPAIVEIMTSVVPAVLFVLWVAAILYFFYLIYLDARLNHDLSPAEGVLAVGIALGVHVVELAMTINPLRDIAYDPDYQSGIRELLIGLIEPTIATVPIEFLPTIVQTFS